MQSEMPLIGSVSGGMKRLPDDLVAKCKTLQEAIRLSINQSPVYRTYEDWAELLGLADRADFCRIINSDQSKRVRNMDYQKTRRLMQLCGNTAIEQWCDLADKGMLDCQRYDDEEKRLMEELERVRARKGA